tara:strand:+ start:476 stop:1588 length:1113 start_codon:yes stop_codon:yes gene_type:complete
MSSLLKEAIVDAKALRESALKNAETSIIEKYSEEVKQTLEQLLEQDDLGLEADQPMDNEDVAKNIPLAATDDLSEEAGEIPSEMPQEGEEVPVKIDLEALQEAVAALENELEENEEIEITEEDLASLLEDDDSEIQEDATPGVTAAAQEEADEDAMDKLEEDDDDDDSGKDAVNADVMGEELDTDSLVDAIMEKLTVDMGADLAGWAGRSHEDITYQIEKELAHRRSTDVEEELETLKKAQEELVFENKQLNEHLSQHKQVVDELKESLQDVNLSNARLLYTNRVLRNASLNERQKEKIAEAISNAGSVTEAKVIYETLQSTVETKPKRSPQSLSEAISNKRSSVIRATRKESTPSDPFQERMKRLAGIK